MDQKHLAPHETMEIHEMLNFKTVALTKLKFMQGIVFDRDLKALMEKDVQQSVQAIQQLQAIQLHEEISKLRIDKKWLHPYNVSEQFQLDLTSAQMIVQIAGMKLFPEDTARLGLVANLELIGGGYRIMKAVTNPRSRPVGKAPGRANGDRFGDGYG